MKKRKTVVILSYDWVHTEVVNSRFYAKFERGSKIVNRGIVTLIARLYKILKLMFMHIALLLRLGEGSKILKHKIITKIGSSHPIIL